MGDLLARTDSRELTEWQAYERVAGPLGSTRVDALFAQLMSVIANVNRGKSQRPYRAEQFLPRWDPEAPAEHRPEMDGEQILRAVKRAQRRMTGEAVARDGDPG